jgi:SAM-dependent methyltransferase
MTPGRLPAVGLPAARKGTPGPITPGLEVMRLFDAKAAGWPGKYGPGGPLSGRLALLSAAVGRHARVGDRVLDLGCGTGELARSLAAAGLRVTGCDISRNMLVHAAARDSTGCHAWVRLEPGWRSLPFKPATFDLVVAASVIEYVTEPGAVLRECARVLRPGGVVLYTVPDLRHPVRWAEWYAQRLARLAGPQSRLGRRTPWYTYRAYLRASRQRHRLWWWLAVSDSAGLHPLPCPVPGTRSALRLLAFGRAEETSGSPERQAGHR